MGPGNTTVMRRPLLAIVCLGVLSATAFTTSPALRRSLGLQSPFTQPTAAFSLFAAQPFVLEESYTSHDRQEKPQVNSGWILALKVPAELAQFRNGLMPVLCVGNTTAERWNSGDGSGQIVITVPSPLNSDGEPQLDLATASIWFAEPQLPERVNASWIAGAQEAADAVALTPFDRQMLEQARAKGGEVLHVRNHNELGKALSHWIDEYAPDEAELAESLR